MDIPLSEVLAAGSAIAATSIGFTKVFFNKLALIEDRFSGAVDRLTTSVNELDKRLAVNSCIIDKFLEEGCHGHRRNKKISTCD
jgi:hypothetical protein